MRNRNQIRNCRSLLKKCNAFSNILHLKLMYSLLFCTEMCGITFQYGQHAEVGYPYIGTFSSKERCSVLAEVGISCCHPLLGRQGNLSTSLAYYIFQIDDVSDPLEDFLIFENDLGIESGIPLKSFYELHLNVEATRWPMFWIVGEKVPIFWFLTYDEDIRSLAPEYRKCANTWWINIYATSSVHETICNLEQSKFLLYLTIHNLIDWELCPSSNPLWSKRQTIWMKIGWPS